MVVVNVEDVLNNNQIPILVQALTSNSTANQNAQKLTEALQTEGKVAPEEQVVGMKEDGTVIKATKDQVAQAQAAPAASPATSTSSGSSGPTASSTSRGGSSATAAAPAPTQGGGAVDPLVGGLALAVAAFVASRRMRR